MPRTEFRLVVSRHGYAAIIACTLMLSFDVPCFAQFGQGGGQTGGGQTGGGQTGGGTIGGGTGGGGTGGTNIGTGGASALGGGLAGPELMTFGADVDPTGGTGFAGRGNAAENFVGGIVQGQGQTTVFGGGGRTNNQFQAINRQGQFRQGFQQPTGPSRSERIRPRHRVAFEYLPRQTASVTTNLQTRLTSLPGAPAGVNVTLNEQGVAVLSGNVSDEQAARLAAALARLEPGVRGVDNQLTVADSP